MIDSAVEVEVVERAITAVKKVILPEIALKRIDEVVAVTDLEEGL